MQIKKLQDAYERRRPRRAEWAKETNPSRKAGETELNCAHHTEKQRRIAPLNIRYTIFIVKRFRVKMLYEFYYAHLRLCCAP